MSSIRSSVSSHSPSKFSVYLGIILIGANLRSPITCVGPLLPDIQASLHLQGKGAGALNALPLLIFAVLSLAAPALGRRHGLERILGLALGAIVAGTLLRSASFSGAIWVGTVLLSAGIAFGNVLLPGLVKREFPSGASELIGYYAAAMAGVAGIAAGVAVPIAKTHGSGWQLSIAVWALPALVALIIWLPQMKAPQHRLGSDGVHTHTSVSPWKHLIGWQVSLFFALHSLIFYSLVDWYPSYAASAGISLTKAGWYLLVYQAVAIATNLACGPIIRKSANQKLLGLSCGVLLLIGTTGLLLVPALSLLWLVAAGLGAGVAMVTSLSLFALRTQDHHHASALSGMAQFVGYAGAATGPFLVGTLRDLMGNWTFAMLLLVSISVLVSIFGTLAGRQRIIA